ncbi:hypothetical protein CR513_53082, partial [Mucuna pruriens]
MEHLSKVGDWETFADVIRLSLFGIVLLPHLDNYVDHAAIDAFWACWKKNKNLVVVLDRIGLPFGQILSIVEKDPIPSLCSAKVTQLEETLAEIEEEKKT